MTEDNGGLNSVELATELTIAWLGNANTRASAEEVPAFLSRMHEAVTGLASGNSAPAEPEAPAEDHQPAVSVRKSLASKDHIISMIDGKPYKTLRRHLATHGLTPESYRQRYKLPTSYPMVAENYSATRRDLARKIGLGRKSTSSAPAAPAAPAEEPAPRKARGAPRKPRVPKAQPSS